MTPAASGALRARRGDRGRVPRVLPRERHAIARPLVAESRPVLPRGPNALRLEGRAQHGGDPVRRGHSAPGHRHDRNRRDLLAVAALDLHAGVPAARFPARRRLAARGRAHRRRARRAALRRPAGSPPAHREGALLRYDLQLHRDGDGAVRLHRDRRALPPLGRMAARAVVRRRGRAPALGGRSAVGERPALALRRRLGDGVVLDRRRAARGREYRRRAVRGRDTRVTDLRRRRGAARRRAGRAGAPARSPVWPCLDERDARVHADPRPPGGLGRARHDCDPVDRADERRRDRLPGAARDGLPQ